jgi:plasmid rolling circle replication initiator protein Rep
MTKIDFNDDSVKHKKRVLSLGAHKRRTRAMVDFLKIHSHDLNFSQIDRYTHCHDYLLFRHYPVLQKTKLHDARHCNIHLLCPMCAIRRAAKQVMNYDKKCQALVAANPNLRLYYAVLTVKNMENLEQGFEHLETSMRLLVQRRREALSYAKGQKKFAYAAKSIFANVSAGAYSFEFKRGKASGLWHPHVNLLLLTEKPVSARKMSAEWLGITKDSHVAYCKKAHESKQSFVEIFKYALKFSDMEFVDNYHAWETLRKRRLCGSFGDFRGLDVSDTDKELDEGTLQDFIELFYRFKDSKYGLEQKDPS